LTHLLGAADLTPDLPFALTNVRSIADTSRLEGIVSKRRDRPIRLGGQTLGEDQNREHPAMSQVMDAFA